MQTKYRFASPGKYEKGADPSYALTYKSRSVGYQLPHQVGKKTQIGSLASTVGIRNIRVIESLLAAAVIHQQLVISTTAAIFLRRDVFASKSPISSDPLLFDTRQSTASAALMLLPAYPSLEANPRGFPRLKAPQHQQH